MTRLFLSALVAATVIAPVSAREDQRSVESPCKVTRQEAQAIALRKVPGTITDTDAEHFAGKCYWSIDIMPNQGMKKEVEVDGRTGAILSVAVDDD